MAKKAPAPKRASKQTASREASALAPFSSKADFYEGSPVYGPGEPTGSPAPVITSTSPASLYETTAPGRVYIYGSFVPGAIVEIDGVPQPTVCDSINTAYIEVFDPMATGPGTFQFAVRNPDGQVSNSWPFTVTDTPNLDSLTPDTQPVGLISCVATGRGFIAGMDLYVNGTRQAGNATFVSDTTYNIGGFYNASFPGTLELKLGVQGQTVKHTNVLPYIITAAE